MVKKEVKATVASETTKAKQSKKAKERKRNNGQFAVETPKPAKAPTPNKVTKQAIAKARTGKLKTADSAVGLIEGLSAKGVKTGESAVGLIEGLSAEGLLNAILVASKVESIILSRQARYDFPADRLEEQVAEFQSWTEGNSTLPDILAPDENFRYDLHNPIIGDELQLKALRRLGYEHYLAQDFPIFLLDEDRKDPAQYSILENALDSVVLESNLPDHPRKTGRIYYLRNRFPFEEVRSNLDKAKGFDKNQPEVSRYTREVVDFPLGRKVWVYRQNKKYKN